MHRNSMRRNPFKRILCLVLVVMMLCSLLVSALSAPPKEPDFRISPLSVTSFTIINQTADPATDDPSSSTWDAVMGWNNIPRLQDGRIWTDKTVVVNAAADDAFDITLSALSQSFPVTSGYVVPADTVFVIDVSGSMYMYGLAGDSAPAAGQPTRIAVLVEALNEAIGILLDANPQNRISVVAFGGTTAPTTLLGLGQYVPGTNGFFYLTGSGSSTVLHVGAVGYSGNLTVGGGTSTQRGIYAGAQILLNTLQLDLNGTMATVDNTDSLGNVTQVTVTRRPNIILMTDGEPTYGWSEPFASLTTTNNRGTGSTAEMGLALLTVLTAAYNKEMVLEHYFPGGVTTPGIAVGQAGPSVGFYTIGIGQAAASNALVMAAMDPGNVNTNPLANAFNVSPTYPFPTGTGAVQTMASVIDEFVTTGSVTFYAAPTSGSTYLATPVNQPTPALTFAQLDFATDFFPANDAGLLQDAFTSITNSIQQQSLTSVTNTTEDPDLSGYLVFSDVLGQYMQFVSGSMELQFPGVAGGAAPPIISPIDLTNAAQESQFANILTSQLNYGGGTSISLTTAQSLIADSMAAGYDSSVRYFADANRNFVANYPVGGFNPATDTPPAGAAALVEIFPMNGTVTSLVTDASTSLMLIAFHVVTALDGSNPFTEIFSAATGINGAQVPTVRTLAPGDQLVRWYIPASLIPVRTVDPGSGAVSGNLQPIQVTYTVALDQARVLAALSATPTDAAFAAYRAANTSTSGTIYFYSNRWQGNQNVTLAFYEPSVDNPFYQPGAFNTVLDRRNTVIKATNNTITAPHVSFFRSFYDDADNSVYLQWLGNNGRLEIELPGLLTLTKAFTFNGVQGQIPAGATFAAGQELEFTIMGPGGLVDTIPFIASNPAAAGDTFAWVAANNRYELITPLELPPGSYNVIKAGGALTGGGNWIYLDSTGISPPGIVIPEQTRSFDFTNEYFTPLPPGSGPALSVLKVFEGLGTTTRPANFQVVIAGPAPVAGSPVYPSTDPTTDPSTDATSNLAWVLNTTTNRYEMVIDRAEIDRQTNPDGVVLRNLAPGVYDVSELNVTVPGFNFTGVSWRTINLAGGTPTLVPGSSGQSATVLTPLTTVTLAAATDDFRLLITNTYELIPPPPSPGDPGDPGDPWPPPTSTPTPTPTSTPTPTVTPGPTPSPSVTPGPTPTPPVTPGPTPTPAVTPSPAVTPTPGTNVTPTPSPGTPPGGGSPQTGDERQTTIFILLLLSGLLCMGGSVAYWNRKKLFYRGKRL